MLIPDIMTKVNMSATISSVQNYLEGPNQYNKERKYKLISKQHASLHRKYSRIQR